MNQGRDRKVRHHFVNRARDFFKRINLPFEIVPSYQPDPPGSFFQGCWLDKGKLYFCPARLKSVGELLHEAGHLALTPTDQWHLLKPGSIEFEPPLGELKYIGDAAVEAWDYAAALAADIPELAVFDKGFNGAGFQIWELFDRQLHPGFALLRFLGMSSTWGKCDRWFVCNRLVSVPALALMEQCTPDERKAILAALQRVISDNKTHEQQPAPSNES